MMTSKTTLEYMEIFLPLLMLMKRLLFQDFDQLADGDQTTWYLDYLELLCFAQFHRDSKSFSVSCFGR